MNFRHPLTAHLGLQENKRISTNKYPNKAPNHAVLRKHFEMVFAFPVPFSMLVSFLVRIIF